jgi:hypothetical protein
LPDNDADAAIPARDVVFVAFDAVEAIDIAGPASVFSKAEQLCPGTAVVGALLSTAVLAVCWRTSARCRG